MRINHELVFPRVVFHCHRRTKSSRSLNLLLGGGRWSPEKGRGLLLSFRERANKCDASTLKVNCCSIVNSGELELRSSSRTLIANITAWTQHRLLIGIQQLDLFWSLVTYNTIYVSSKSIQLKLFSVVSLRSLWQPSLLDNYYYLSHNDNYITITTITFAT